METKRVRDTAAQLETMEPGGLRRFGGEVVLRHETMPGWRTVDTCWMPAELMAAELARLAEVGQ